MDDEVLNEFENEIRRLTAELKNYDPGTEEYKCRVERIRTLSELANAGRKIAADYDVRTTESDRELRVKEEEIELKKEEIEFKKKEHDEKLADEKEKRKNNLVTEFVKGGFQIGGVVIPLWFYSWFLDRGWHFETTGIISSSTFRNFLRSIRPKK